MSRDVKVGMAIAGVVLGATCLAIVLLWFVGRIW